MSPHSKAILQALFVTFIWSLSWVFIKIGLQDIPPLTFAGLRYSIAAGCLLVLALRSKPVREAFATLSYRQWGRLVLLGVVFYALTQGAQFLALSYLPAVTLSLLLNFTTIVVALMGIPLLGEKPTGRQWFGIGVFLTGVLVYFWPINFPAHELLGLFIGLVALLSNAAGSLLGRSVNRTKLLPPLLITVVSMGIGSLLLLSVGIVTQGLPPLSLSNWLLILWLAVVHTAFTFTLWNTTLRTLNAVESSIINSTMLIQIALLAWLFLGETISPLGIAGLGLAVAGSLIVQLNVRRKAVARKIPAREP